MARSASGSGEVSGDAGSQVSADSSGPVAGSANGSSVGEGGGPDRSMLDQREGESEKCHRAFLLFVMQDPDRRNLSATGRAVGRAESTVRSWRSRWSWPERIEALGSTSDVLATAAYREWYYPKFRLREIVEIEEYLSAPFSPEAAVPKSVAQEVRSAVRGDSGREAKREAARQARRRHLALVDGALGLVARRVANGEVRVNLRDIPVLLDLRDRLEEPTAAQSGSGVIIESVRVKVARETGADVIAAMHEDAQELTAILGAIRSAGEVPESLRAGQAGPAGGES